MCSLHPPRSRSPYTHIQCIICSSIFHTYVTVFDNSGHWSSPGSPYVVSSFSVPLVSTVCFQGNLQCICVSVRRRDTENTPMREKSLPEPYLWDSLDKKWRVLCSKEESHCPRMWCRGPFSLCPSSFSECVHLRFKPPTLWWGRLTRGCHISLVAFVFVTRTVFSSSLLFVDPCSDFCSFYLLVWGRPWGTGWGTCLILLLKKKCLERKERVCCPSSRFQSLAEVSTQDLVRQRTYGSPSIPGLSIFSLIRNLCCSRLFFWSHHEQRQWGIRMRRCSLFF